MLTRSIETMQVTKYFIGLLFLISCESPDSSLLLLDPDKPGVIPEMFAEGIISKEGSTEFSICFAPDLSEILFSRRVPGEPNQIMVMNRTGNQWSDPKPFEYAQNCFEFEPYISPDGNYLFYGSKRPLPGSDTLNWFPDIWICKKNGTEWEKPEHYNTGMMYLSMTKKGKIYYTGFPDTWDGQFVACKDSLYSEPRKLSEAINYLPFAGHPLIGPDEDYLIYDSQVETDEKDLYISFKTKDGDWTKGIKMGSEINTELDECCAMLSPCNKYLFFAREADLYWVSSEIIEQYKARDFKGK